MFDSLVALRAGGLLSVGSLLAVFVGQATNWLVLGPMTSRLLYERDRLEKGEKKGPEVSVVLKSGRMGVGEGASWLVSVERPAAPRKRSVTR